MPQPYGQVADKYSVYTPQGAHRATFSHFSGSGLDAFANTNANNPDGYFKLDNLLPAVNGGFNRRWGTSSLGTISNFGANIARMFPYQVSAEGAVSGDYYSGFSNYYSILATDNTTIQAIYNEGTNDNQQITGFSGTGQVYAINSRDFVYAFDGVYIPKKKHLAITTDTQSNIGIGPPRLSKITGLAGGGTAYNPATTTYSVNTSTGSGASLVFNYQSYGTGTGLTGVNTYTLMSVSVTAGGSGYAATDTITITDSGTGNGAAVTPTVYNGAIVGVSLNGGITLNQGRRYAVAYQNSKTGHTSDATYTASSTVAYQNNALFAYPAIASTYIDTSGNQQTVTNIACSALSVYIELFLDNVGTIYQNDAFDTVVLLATSDGGDMSHLYQVALIPTSSFTHVPGSPSGTNSRAYYLYIDTMGDTYTDYQLNGYTTGTTLPPTLLDQNLYSDVDAYGDPIGILFNSPPLYSYNKPVLNQGRLFATDGKSVFFSKSIDEVTTSTGLITSKWEEAWPATNRLDIAFSNEIIVGLLSDTSNLYIGTTQNIYRLNGTNANNFEVQCIFRNIGLLSQDCWSVVYKDSLPAGYMWVTPDLKVMLSDFNTYENVGAQIWPLLTGATNVFLQPCTYGPYNLVMLKSSLSDTFIFNLNANTWYRWQPSIGTGPVMAYTSSAGATRLYFTTPNSTNSSLGFFDPTVYTDAFPSAATPIHWAMRTGWHDLGDSTMIKVINEIELWSIEAGLAVNVWTLTGPGTQKELAGVAVAAPTQAMSGLQKAYFAAKNTGAKLHSFEIVSSSNLGYFDVLDQFTVDAYPFGRF